MPDDIDEILKRVIDLGGKVLEKGEFVAGEPYIYFTDPDGYIIEVWFELTADKR